MSLTILSLLLCALFLCHVHGHLDKTNEGLIELLRKYIKEEERHSESNAKDWLVTFNDQLQKVYQEEALAEFEYNTNLTEENAEKFSEISVKHSEWMNRKVKEAKEYLAGKTKQDFQDKSTYRMLKLLTCGSTVSDKESVNKKISDLINELGQIYGTTEIEGHTLDELEDLMSTASYTDRLRYWVAWRDAVGPQMKPLYTELIANLNQAATDNGFSDIGEPWRCEDFGYETENLEELAAALFKEIEPLYLQLHAYVRRVLYNKYPEGQIDLQGPIPAHILGNMWAQEWIIDGFRPYPEEPEIDISSKLKAEYSVVEMFEMAEDFFTSIGLEKMTETFWKKSMISRPDDREVQCHASASDLYKTGDYRIKMCTKKNQEDLAVIHHEMGHIEYFMEYSHQPTLFRTGANAAFHEAIGDTIALSVNTATHLEAINLLDSFSQNEKSDINLLMKMAFQKIAFLPFGYLIDLYRWKIFRGEVDETNYNSEWWKLRLDIQGIVPPVERTEQNFDPGAKYHIAANVPYIRYFFAHIAQFQFLEAMMEKSGCHGPLHTCDFYKSQEAGNLLKSMLQLGASEEWPVAMAKITGQEKFSTDAILKYFKPLETWLIKQNQENGEYIGWK